MISKTSITETINLAYVRNLPTNVPNTIMYKDGDMHMHGSPSRNEGAPMREMGRRWTDEREKEGDGGMKGTSPPRMHIPPTATCTCMGRRPETRVRL